jgi:hypothetical protein
MTKFASFMAQVILLRLPGAADFFYQILSQRDNDILLLASPGLIYVLYMTKIFILLFDGLRFHAWLYELVPPGMR